MLNLSILWITGFSTKSTVCFVQAFFKVKVFVYSCTLPGIYTKRHLIDIQFMDVFSLYTSKLNILQC